MNEIDRAANRAVDALWIAADRDPVNKRQYLGAMSDLRMAIFHMHIEEMNKISEKRKEKLLT